MQEGGWRRERGRDTQLQSAIILQESPLQSARQIKYKLLWGFSRAQVNGWIKEKTHLK